jgi:hypothetical protein
VRTDRVDVASPAILVFAVALPFLFLHASFQPSIGANVGSTRIDFRLSDLAVLVIAAAALVAGRGHLRASLARGRPVWITAGAFLLFVFAACIYPLAAHSSYPWQTHLVTAVKYAEYALLAPAAAILLRRPRDLVVILWSLAAVSVAATAVSLLQFAGAGIFRAWPSGGRQPSFVGVDDLGMLSATSFAVALAIVALGPASRRDGALAWTAGLAGALGMIVSGALAGVLGAVLAAAAALVVSRLGGLLGLRRALAIAGMVAVVVLGSVVMRSSAIGSFARFAGLGHDNASGRVESYSHRWVLDYIGYRIFLSHPVVGAGWQSGFDEETYGPVLPAARHRFPSQPPRAYPAPSHSWGIQSAYVEVLAELGIAGAALFVAWIASGLVLATQPFLGAAREAAAWPRLVGLLWICVALGVWNGIWLVAGIPFDAVIWLAFGLAAAPLVLSNGRTK